MRAASESLHGTPACGHVTFAVGAGRECCCLCWIADPLLQRPAACDAPAAAPKYCLRRPLHVGTHALATHAGDRPKGGGGGGGGDQQGINGLADSATGMD